MSDRIIAAIEDREEEAVISDAEKSEAEREVTGLEETPLLPAAPQGRRSRRQTTKLDHAAVESEEGEIMKHRSASTAQSTGVITSKNCFAAPTKGRGIDRGGFLSCVDKLSAWMSWIRKHSYISLHSTVK